MTIREKPILAKTLRIQNENWGLTTHFLEIIKEQLFSKKAVKYKTMSGVFFFQIEALLSLKNAWLPPIFFWDKKEHLLSSAFSA